MKARARQTILIAAALVVAALLLWPPYIVHGNGITLNAGYDWIFAPPYPRATVAIGTLFAEFLGVSIITALLYLAASPRRA